MKTEAKKAALKELRNKAHKEGGAGMFGGMGVTVKAKDKKSLLEGLEKASEIVEKKGDELEEKAEKLSQEEIKAKIAELQELLED